MSWGFHCGEDSFYGLLSYGTPGYTAKVQLELYNYNDDDDDDNNNNDDDDNSNKNIKKKQRQQHSILSKFHNLKYLLICLPVPRTPMWFQAV